MTVTRLAQPLVLAVMTGVLCGSAGCSTVRSKLQPKWLTPAGERVEQRLQRPVRIGLQGQPLHQALEWLRQLAGTDLRFHVNWPALRDAGATPQTPIRLSIERTTVGAALRAVLQSASADYALNPIDYRIAGGMVLISTRDDLYRSINVRAVYNIRDIIVNLSDYGDLPGYRPKDAGATPPAVAAGAARLAAVDHLIQIIFDTVGSHQDWHAGSMHEINGDLIVVTTPDNQRQIEALLKDLRKSRKRGRKVLKKERRKSWLGRWLP